MRETGGAPVRTVYFALGILSLILFHSGCGNRFDINTERGRQAIVDEANNHLSNGECQAAIDAIEPLYTSTFVNDEIRIIRASGDACFSNFSMLTLLANVADKPNFYEALAKTMQNNLNDGKIAALYRATDILTVAGAQLLASQRTKKINDFMVFLQLGVMGAIQDAYGAGTSEGVQAVTFNYLVAGAGTLSNADGCAYAAAVGFIRDSFNNSNLGSNSQAGTAIARLDSICTLAGTTCATINKNRAACDGANAASLTADAIVDQVNTAW
jgi:hypothetical protein